MRYLLSVFFLFSALTLFCYAENESLLRIQGGTEADFQSLLRMTDRESSMEILLGDLGEKEIRINRLILESPDFLLGNIKPSGLFVFSGMTGLVYESDLGKKTGFVPDRGASHFERPGFAALWPLSGGLFLQALPDSFLYSGVWQEVSPIPYMNLQVLIQSCSRGGSEMAEDEWFPMHTEMPRGRFWQGAAAFSYEASKWSCNIRSAYSGGSHFYPGSALMPEIVFYDSSSVYRFAYWRNSRFYRNKEGEFPDWGQQFQFHYSGILGISRLEGYVLTGESKPGPDVVKGLWRQEYRAGWYTEALQWEGKWKTRFVYDPGEIFPYSLEPQFRIAYMLHSWKFALQGTLTLQLFPYAETFREAEFSLLRKRKRVLSNSIGVVYKADPEVSTLTSGWECRLNWQNLGFTGSVRYPFGIYGQADHEMIFRLSMDMKW